MLVQTEFVMQTFADGMHVRMGRRVCPELDALVLVQG